MEPFLMIEVLYKNKDLKNPKVSIILCDWSVRESSHILDYLENQTISRDHYEIIWIEYYQKKWIDLEKRINKAQLFGKRTPLDQWIVMNMPKNLYYHKHLMYNIGIIASRGEIVTICDSDTFVKNTFVESITKSFEVDKNIFLHMDQIRNFNTGHYPFKYPSLSEFLKQEDCEKLEDLGRPVYQTRNYGACFSAPRSDLIAIGGADEHIDYLGHVCGPYDMSFRLLNFGKKEVWHETEKIFHAYHPGQGGRWNYLGPHDGRNTSLRALGVLNSSRIFPYVENQAIQILRVNKEKDLVTPILQYTIPHTRMTTWQISHLKRIVFFRNLKDFTRSIVALFLNLKGIPRKIVIGSAILKVLFQQFISKCTAYDFSKIRKNKSGVIRTPLLFFYRGLKNNIYLYRRCRDNLRKLEEKGIKEISIAGNRSIVRILITCSKYTNTKVKNIYDEKAYPSISLDSGEVVVFCGTFTDSVQSFPHLGLKRIQNENFINIL